MSPVMSDIASTTTRTAPGDGTPSPMALLGSGVPLSLLLDLALGPCSEELLRDEPGPASPWWAPAA